MARDLDEYALILDVRSSMSLVTKCCASQQSVETISVLKGCPVYSIIVHEHSITSQINHYEGTAVTKTTIEPHDGEEIVQEQ